MNRGSPSSEIGSSPLKGCEGNCRPGRKYWQPTARFMTHVTCRLTAKNRDQLQNPTLGNRVRATFTFLVPMIRSPEAVGVQGATRAGERQTHRGTTRKQTRNRRCGVVIIARWPHVSHTAFSYSTYSRRHVIGYRRRPASL